MDIQQAFTSNLASLGNQVTFSTRTQDVGSLKKMQAADLVQTNMGASQFSGNTQLNALQQAAAVSDGSIGPRYTSYQILAEPVKAISPDSVVNSTIAVNSTMAQAIVGKAPETLDKMADLSQKPDQIKNKEIKDCLKAAGKKCATLAEQEANQAELAHGNVLEVSHAARTIAGNAIRMHSDTTIAARAPHWGLNTQDYHVQANNSAVLVADIQMNQVKQSVNFVEGSHITQARTGLMIATDTHDNVSKQLRNIGVEEYTSMGKTHTAVADETMVSLSGGSISNAAYGSIAHRAGGDISIVSSPNGKSGEGTNALGETTDGATTVAQKTGQIILMGTDGQNMTNVVALTKEGNISSSTGNAVTVAGKSAVLTGQKAAMTVSPKVAFIGSLSGGVMVRGRRVYVNTMNALSANLQPLQIQKLPALPSLPKIATDSLENCIPKDMKQGAGGDSSGSGSGTSGSGNAGTSNDKPALKPGGRSPLNPKQLPRQLDKSSSSPTPGSRPSKLPGVSATDGTDKAQSAGVGSVPGYAALDTGGLTGASMNIYLDKYDETPAISLTESLTGSTQSLTSALTSEEIVQGALEQGMRAASISPEMIASYLRGVLPTKALNAFNDPELFKALAQVGVSKVSAGNVKAQDFAADTPSEIVQSALKLLKAYPQAQSGIVSIIQAATALPAIGFLGALGGLISSLKIPGMAEITKLTQIPNLVSSGNMGGLLQLASPYLGSLLQGSPLEKILGNSSLLNIGQSLLTGDMSGIQEAVQGAVLGQIGNLLGSEFAGAAPMIGNLLMNLQSGKPIDATSLIGQIGSMIGGDIGKATQVFGTLQPILKDLSSGNILNLVTGGGLQSLLSQVLGGQNAGEIGKIFGMVQQMMGTVQALSALPQLLETMNKYKIPALDQISMALNCLDLFNKLKGLMDQAKGSQTSNKEAAQFLDSAGRLAQTINSLNTLQDLPKDQLESLGIDPIFLSLKIPMDLDPCFKVPRLTLAQSQVTVLEVNPSRIKFTVDNLELLQATISMLPKEGDTIQLRISSFIDNKTNEVLTPYQTDFQYTPSNYGYVITEFDVINNVGIAVFNQGMTSIILENNSGILYEYDPTGIGNQLTPIIEDSYLLV